MVTGSTNDHGSPEDQRFPGDRGGQGSSTEARDGDERSFGDKLRHPFPDLRDKLKDTKLYDLKVGAIHLKHRIGKFENLVNSNHRHDEEHEKETDAKRTRIGESHRFQSFAPERDGNQIKWYVDGRDYYHAVSVALERATETIYIADWWLSPELHLRRPPHYHREWRLDFVLKRAAERGVKIYITLYKEVAAALTCNSAHSKHALEALCPKGSKGFGNITVMRHPDHNFLENASDMTFYWAHHEKFIVIDYNLAFIGGLDLCFGRWDTKQHALTDAHPEGVDNEIFPGQDFNNNRIMDFQTVEDWKSNELSKVEYGRMPWHDVAMGVIGPCIYDIAEHFILRWNFCKRDKYKRDEQYDWLMLAGRTGENEDLVGVQRPKHPVGDYILHPLSPIEKKAAYPLQQTKLVPRVDGSERPAAAHGEFDDTPEQFHDAAETLDEHGYTKDQHQFGHGPEKFAHEHGLHRPHLYTDKSLPLLPKEEGQQELGVSNHEGRKQDNAKMTGNNPKKDGFVTASGGVHEHTKGYASTLVEKDETQGGHGTVHAQLVRSSADWSSGILTEQSIQNAYCQVIRDAKHFVYIENQFFITATGDQQAPIHNLIGAAIVDACLSAHREDRKFRVIIVIPAIPGFAGDLRSDPATGTRAIMDYQYKSINRGEHSIFGRLRAQDVDPTKYIFVFNLRSYDRINKTPGMKKQEEKSGVTYEEVQRAQAKEVMGSATEGGPDKNATKKFSLSWIMGKDKDKTREQQEADAREGASSRSSSDLDFDPSTETQRNRSEAEKKKDFADAEPGAEEGYDPKVFSVDSIAKNALLGEKKVSEEAYEGRNSGPKSENDETPDAERQMELREQEKENFIQEELYIHGKLLIADDRIVICGSSNINDRSQLGFHDSELSIVMEDTLPLPSKMNGKDYIAGHHAASLRRILWREHLGLIYAQPLDAGDDPNAQPPGDGVNDFLQGDEWDELVTDPLSDELWNEWTTRATTNTLVFRQLFHADPDDNVKTFEDYDRFMPPGAIKAGHLFDQFQPVDTVRSELDKVKGHLVWYPLEFLRDAEMAKEGLQVNSWTESVYT